MSRISVRSRHIAAMQRKSKKPVLAMRTVASSSGKWQNESASKMRRKRKILNRSRLPGRSARSLEVSNALNLVDTIHQVK